MAAFALSTAFAIVCFAQPAIAATFDGNWNMFVVTTNGHCGTVKVGLAISGGRISSTSGRFAFHRIQVAGLVSGTGQTRMNGVAGPRIAKGIGRFVRSRGGGKWAGDRALRYLLGHLDRRSLLMRFGVEIDDPVCGLDHFGAVLGGGDGVLRISSRNAWSVFPYWAR